MITDNHKKITIAYNHLNLPKKITYDSGSWIEFTYDATGRKLTKTLSTGVPKNYVGAIEYSGANLESIYHSEGRLTPNGASFYYEYSIKDHLGNNRLMFRANGASAQILQESHQHPFGMEMEASYYATQVGTENGYKYNGKELNEDFGLNWYAYGARFYDPAIGRFTGVDPIADKFANLAVYNYASNDPIKNIDLHGLQGINPNKRETRDFINIQFKGAVTQGVYGSEFRFAGARAGTTAKIAAQELFNFEAKFGNTSGGKVVAEAFSDEITIGGATAGDIFGASIEHSKSDKKQESKSKLEINLGLFYYKAENVNDEKTGKNELMEFIGIQVGKTGGAGIIGYEVNAKLEFRIDGKTPDTSAIDKIVKEQRQTVQKDNTATHIPLEVQKVPKRQEFPTISQKLN